MSRCHFLKTVLVASAFSLSAMTVFAVEAPVFEADDYPEAGSDQGQGTAATSSAASAPEIIDNDSGGNATNSDDVPPSSSLTQGQRIDRLEQQVDNLQHAEGGTKLNHFQEEIQTLRGKVEELTHQLEQMQVRQQTMYTDLDRRIGAKSAPLPVIPPVGHKKAAVTATSTAIASSVPSKSAQPNVAEEQQTYQLAYDLIKSEKYDQAIAALQSMLHKYPSGQFAANAHYWLGELYGLQGKNTLSATEFQTVLKQYPGSPRIADAGLKLGLIFAAELKWREAKAAFKNVINRYPGTASARLASEQLKQIKQAGH